MNIFIIYHCTGSY